MKDSATHGDGRRRIAGRGAAALLLGASVCMTGLGIAQENPSASSAAPSAVQYSPEELEDLVGRIALYPDDLIAIILPASTYPLQVVEAARFAEQHKNDPSLEPDPSWDDSVVALLNYPEVLDLMNDDLEWTAKLGDAVASQQADVFDAIQSFRDRALAKGSLRSDEHQVVTQDKGDVEIKPADPEVVYVPYYEPARVVAYSAPIYYYPVGYPLYYYPYPAGYAFSSGFFWGVTTAFVIGWHTHHLHVHPWTYVGHPFYGHDYYTPFYVRRGIGVNVSVNLVHVDHGGYLWRASPARRVHYTRPTAISYEGRYRGQFSTRSSGRLYDPRRYPVTTSTREHYRHPDAANGHRTARVAPSDAGARRSLSTERAPGRAAPERASPSYRSGGSPSYRSGGSSSDRPAGSSSDRSDPRSSVRARTSVRSAPTYRSPSLQSLQADRSRTMSSYRAAPPRATAPRAAPYRAEVPRASAPSRATAPRATAPSRAAPSRAAPSSPTYRSGSTRGSAHASSTHSRGGTSSRASASSSRGPSSRGHYR